MPSFPKEPTESLHSWRSSDHGRQASRQQDASDLEKGQAFLDGKGPEPLWWRDDSSIGMSQQPSKSTQGLHQTDPQQRQHPTDQPSPSSQPPINNSPVGIDANNKTEPTIRSQPQRRATLPSQTASMMGASLFGHIPKINDPDPAAARLRHEKTPLTPTDFYKLMGMRPPSEKNQKPSELMIPQGLYARIYRDMHYTQTKYRIFDFLAYACLLLQLLFSTLFTTLGSLTSIDTHVPIVMLGTLSIIISGALALVKGQGLPNRLRQARDGLSNVIFEADELYWDVSADRQVYYKDVKKIREDYLRVIENNRQNHPDMWAASTNRMAPEPSTMKHASFPTMAPSPAHKL